MSQVSPPIRILLIGAVVFMAAWMTVLKPKTEEEAPPAATTATAANVQSGAPAVSQSGKAVQTAQQAAATASQAASARAGEAPASAPSTTSAAPASAAAKPATATAPAGQPAAAAGSKGSAASQAALPTSVAKAIADKKVLVMLFWNSKGLDDRAVRREMRGIDRHKGKVKVHVADIKDVARYGPITRGVNMDQSPTVVVVDRKLQAEALVGYNDRGLIQQAVSDALRAR